MAKLKKQQIEVKKKELKRFRALKKTGFRRHLQGLPREGRGSRNRDKFNS
jgi:hypothetical protein